MDKERLTSVGDLTGGTKTGGALCFVIEVTIALSQWVCDEVSDAACPTNLESCVSCAASCPETCAASCQDGCYGTYIYGNC